MFGRYTRAAAAFGAMGIAATFINEVMMELVPAMREPYQNTSNSSEVAGMFIAVNKWFIVICFLSLVVLLFAGALVESQKGGFR